MGLEVLFGHLLPELQWDSSNHLLPSAGQRARQGPPGQPDVCAHLCPGVVQLPPRGSRAALCPAAPTPRGLQPGKGAVAPEPAPRRDKPEVGLWPSTLEPGGDGTTEGSDWSLQALWPAGMSQGMSPRGRAQPGSPATCPEGPVWMGRAVGSPWSRALGLPTAWHSKSCWVCYRAGAAMCPPGSLAGWDSCLVGLGMDSWGDGSGEGRCQSSFTHGAAGASRSLGDWCLEKQ